MNGDLTADHLVMAGVALAAGLLGAFLLRVLLRWLAGTPTAPAGAATT